MRMRGLSERLKARRWGPLVLTLVLLASCARTFSRGGTSDSRPDAGQDGGVALDGVSHRDSPMGDGPTADGPVTPILSWPITLGGDGNEIAKELAIDAADNLYMTGSFSGTLSVGDVTLVSRGGTDIFLVSVASGGALRWATSFGGSADDAAVDVVVDAQGNVAVAALFAGSLQVGAQSVTSAGGRDVLLASFTAEGVARWALAFGSSAADRPWELATGQGSELVLTGLFGGDMAIGTFELVNQGSSDVFVVKTSTEGVVQWALAFGGRSADEGTGVTIAPSGEIYLSGQFTQSMDLPTGTLRANASGTDVFWARLSGSGDFLAADSFGSVGFDSGGDVLVDQQGNTYIVGYFDADLDLGRGPLPSAGDYDVFVASYSSTGALRWATSLYGTGLHVSMGSAVDERARALRICGYFSGELTTDSGTVQSAGASDVFVASFALDTGALLRAEGFGGGGTDEGHAVAVDSNGNTYVAGMFSQNVTFGSNSVVSRGGTDGFVIKMPP